MAATFSRHWRHLTHLPGRVHRAFPQQAMEAIAQAIHAAEQRHGGEIRVALEGALDWPELRRGLSARDRAIDLFSSLRVWDTEANDGVLLYLLLADHAVEIVADRGIARQVPQSAWDAICARMRAPLRAGDYLPAVLQGVQDISALLAEHAGSPDGHNELSDWPVVIRR